jgi:hypothetical protein
MSAMPGLVANRSASSSINFSSYLIICNSFKELERKIGGKLTSTTSRLAAGNAVKKVKLSGPPAGWMLHPRSKAFWASKEV